MDQINDDSLDERIKAEWTELYAVFFEKAFRYAPSISQNRKEDGENGLHTAVERTLERMWLQHYGHEIKRLFFEEQRDLTQIRQYLAQSYGFPVSEERLRHFLRPSRVRKDFSDRTPDDDQPSSGARFARTLCNGCASICIYQQKFCQRRMPMQQRPIWRRKRRGSGSCSGLKKWQRRL